MNEPGAPGAHQAIGLGANYIPETYKEKLQSGLEKASEDGATRSDRAPEWNEGRARGPDPFYGSAFFASLNLRRLFSPSPPALFDDRGSAIDSDSKVRIDGEEGTINGPGFVYPCIPHGPTPFKPVIICPLSSVLKWRGQKGCWSDIVSKSHGGFPPPVQSIQYNTTLVAPPTAYCGH